MFVMLAVVLTALVASLSLAVWRLNGRVGDLRVERDRLEERLARERSTREALTLELGRLRGAPSAGAVTSPPTLTLEPLGIRGSAPPPPTMTAPPPAQVVELRLVLPARAGATLAPYDVTVRDWVTGHVRLTRGGLATTALDRGRAVTAFVPGDVFGAGSHEVILRSRESEIASYEITVR
jgi:hypothetical protein